MLDKSGFPGWSHGLLNHFVNRRFPTTLETLKHAFNRGAAFFLPAEFPGADLIIPIQIPGLEMMTFCAIQIRNRQRDTFNLSIKFKAVSHLKKAVNALEWS